MSINTTVKVGFDGTAVKTGLKGIGAMFQKFNKEIAIGAARKVGENLLGAATRGLQSLTDTPQMLMDYASGLKELSATTGETINNLQQLQEAFKLAGVDSLDAGKSILLLEKALEGAMTDALTGKGADSEVIAFLDKLKLSLADLRTMKPAAKIKAIFAAMKGANLSTGEAFAGMQLLFGKGSMKLMTVFGDNFEATMEKAKNNLAGFGKITDKEINDLEALSDEFGRLPLIKMQGLLALMKGFMGVEGMGNIVEQVSAKLDGMMASGAALEQVGAKIRAAFDYMETEGFSGLKQQGMEWAGKLGDAFGLAAAAAVKKYMFGGTALEGLMKQSSAANIATPVGDKNRPILMQMLDTLKAIHRVGGAIFQ